MGEEFGTIPFLNFNIDAFLNIAGDDPLTAMLYLFLHGGWIVFVFVFFWALKYGWLEYIQNKANAQREWILLRISVPKASEQTCRAAENLFANLAGAHSPAGWTETWIKGATQAALSVEIASLDGEVGLYVHSLRGLRDLVEASIYAQYPDAEIEEVEDYAKKVPANYPDEKYDMWGTEMRTIMPDSFPIKTYPEFEDKISGEFKDPLAAVFEIMSRLGKGEQAWFQIVIVPTDQREARGRAEKLVNKLKGIKETPKKSWVDSLLEIPLGVIKDFVSVFMGGSAAPAKSDKKEEFPRMMALSPGEKMVLEAVERKTSKLGFMCKIRIVYVCQQEVFKKGKFVAPFIGAIKQINTYNMQALAPESKHVGLKSDAWWFKEQRNAVRKGKLIRAYRSRSGSRGLKQFFMSVEELATLWHFPILMQVKAPSLRRIESKKSEPPSYIPFS